MATRLNVNLPDELKSVMDQIAQEKQITMTDVFRQAIALYIASVQSKKNGEKIGMFREQDGRREVTTEIVGI